MAYLGMLLGVALLLVGGELLVRHSSRLALLLGLSPLVIGLTVVAFGTSAPELIISVYSRLSGQSSMAIGNVVGSNIFNVLFILGVSALVAPLAVDTKLVRFDLPVVLVVSVATAGFAYSGAIGRVESVVLFATLLAHTVWSIVKGLQTDDASTAEIELPRGTPAEPETGWIWSALLVVVGVGLLVLGGRFFVSGAIDTARLLGISETVIGLTIVAAGTSLPELVTSVLASLRDQREIAVGNVVGSNLFNLTGVLGLTGMLGTGELVVPPSVLGFDVVVMVLTAVACIPLMLTAYRIDRWEGALLVLGYVAYTAYLVAGQIGVA